MLAAGQLALLASRPYASALLYAGAPGADVAPITSSFSLGPLAVDMPAFEDPKLEPFRALMRTSCPNRQGLAAAICLANELAHRFPHGAPRNEFFSRQYDPAADLALHLAGAPGHCVTRSALLATTLLASGQPSRLMQLITPDGVGHNVMEVFDQAEGWVIVDPSYGHIVLNSRDEANRRIHKRIDLPTGTATSFLDKPDALRGLRIYPEPWLYTRVGERHGFWPFRGAFVAYGLHYRRTVTIHTLLMVGIVLCVLFSVGLAAQGVFQAISRRSQQRQAIVASPEVLELEQDPSVTCRVED